MGAYRLGTKAFVEAQLAEMRRLRVAAVSTNQHLQVSKDGDGATLAVTGDDADDLDSLLLLVNEIIGIGKAHLSDTGAHKIADATSWPAFGAAIDLTTAQTALNLMKTTWGTHLGTTYHYTADSTNTIAAANATNQATSETLANELKDDITAHILLGLAGETVELRAG